MLVRQQTASHNPLLSSSSDNASSTPPLRLLSSSTSTPSRPPPNNLRKLLNQLFRRLTWTDTHMLLELTQYAAGVNLSPHRFLVWCADVCADVWGVIDTESQRVPLCSPMHLPGASQCSYCDLLASKCILFSVCCSSRLQAGDECRSPDAAQRSLGAPVAPTKGFLKRNLYNLSFLDVHWGTVSQCTIVLRREET